MESEQQAVIEFKLLVPRAKLLRLDVLPFVILYFVLIYEYMQTEAQSNLSIYLRLSMIGVGFINCLTYIFGHWSKKMQAVIQYRKLKGPLKDNLEKASHVFVAEKKVGYNTVYGISDFYKAQQEGETLYLLYFEQCKFYYDFHTQQFRQLRPYYENVPFGEIIAKRSNIAFKSFYDENILQVQIREFWDIFREQIIDPFSFFQLFSVFLWMLDANQSYPIMLLIMLFMSAYTISMQRIKTLVGFRSMMLAPHEVFVFEQSQWKPKSTYDLRPGDIVAVVPGHQHKKMPFEMQSDGDYLKQALPFSSIMPQNMMKSADKEENSSYRTVPCDILLLSGACVANESILTGEAIPQIKEPLQKYQFTEQFTEGRYKSNILFCGTEVIQINENCKPEEYHQIIDVTNHLALAKAPYKNCCIGMVMTTGFDTSKGNLIRKIIANAESMKVQHNDGLWIILFLLICALFTSAYVLDQGMENTERSKEKLFLRCILIITTVVPPQLPMILTLSVNNSILYLQKKRIFISEPKKIPLGGKVSIVAFDKTGTLTEDKLIFEGIVENCENYQHMQTLKNCSKESTSVMAGCQSLISVDKELTGDPIELMFFQLTDWHYSSKNKEARKMLERVTVQKVFPFKSELKRMSTLVEYCSENGNRTLRVLTKGAPEAIQLLLHKVPNNYTQAYQYYTAQGYRLLCLAYRDVSFDLLKEDIDKQNQRANLERDLHFTGFFICSSPLKEDTQRNIAQLQQAQYKILIITGDNILTAIKVGLSINLGKEAWILEQEGDKMVLENVKHEKKQIDSPKELEAALKQGGEGVMLATSTSKNLPPALYPYICIFARTSPHDKEVIVKKIKQITKQHILYAGDGTNDVGGLRMADVGVAVVGTSTMSEVQNKEEQAKEDMKDLTNRMNRIKTDMAMPIRKKMEAIAKVQAEMKQKGGGPMGAMMMEDEIKVGDACIAAPFTSKHSNSIKCVLIIIRQAVATLVTTIQTYKILAISSMLQAYSLAEMNLANLKYSDHQMMVIGILAAINFYYFSNAKPLKKISHIRAPHTIFNIWFGISFFGQIIIFLGCNYYALNLIGMKYLPPEDRNISADAQFQKSFLNTVILLFSSISQSAVFIVNHGGQPHMQSLLKNSRYFKFLIIPLVVSFIATSNVFPDLSSMLDLKFDNVPYQANIEMMTVFGVMVSSTYLLDRLCRFAQYKHFIGWL